MQKPSHSKRGFTLIELLTVIAILAILGAIIFPTVGQFRSMAKRSSDAEDLRNIVTASHLLATQNGEKYVDIGQTVEATTNGSAIIYGTGETDLVDVAAVLAYGGGLNNPEVWTSANEEFIPKGALLKNGAPNSGSEGYSPSDFSYDYVAGLASWMESTTPLAYSRMADESESSWSPGDVYDEVGGHVAFIGGSVGWYENLNGKLVSKTGEPADDIDEVVTSYNGGTAETVKVIKATPPSPTD